MSDRLLASARRWFDPGTVNRFFEPLIADWQHERSRASNRRDRVLSTVRGGVTFLATVALLLPQLVFASLDRATTRSATRRMLLFSTIGTLILAAPEMTGSTRRMGLAMTLLLLPSVFTLVIAFAPLAIVEFARRESGLRAYEQRRLVLRSVLVACLWILLGGGWLTPMANQGYRDAMGASLQQRHPDQRVTPVRRGVRELTSVELFQPPPPDLIPMSDAQSSMVAEIHSRFSLLVLPAALAFLRWVMLGASRQRRGFRWSSAAVWVLAIIGIIGLRSVGISAARAYGLSPSVGVWAAPLLTILIAIDLQILFAGRQTAVPEGAIG